MDKTLKKEYTLKGLDCGNCAAKIEKESSDIDGVKSAIVDFMLQKLIIEIDNPSKEDVITEKVEKIVKRVHPSIQVIEISHKEKVLKKHGHQDGHDHDENSKEDIIRLVVGIVLLGGAAITNVNFLKTGLYLVAYLIIGGEVILSAIKNIKNGEIFDENFLMMVATIGAFCIGEYAEGVAVMLFYQVGEMFQGIAVNSSRKSIANLMDIRPDFANLKAEDGLKKVSPEDVKINDVIVVKPGEKVPLDGIIIDGSAMIDTSMLTGESVPKEVSAGDSILGGVVNKNGLLTIKVEKEFKESTVAKILDLVQNASSKKASTENFITKFARYYTPVVVFAAVALAIFPPLFIKDATFSQWIYRALSFLVVSCPCALVISIPLGFFGGIGGASRHGVLVKGGNYLEALNHAEIVVFDKTGTLTKGVFKVTDIKPQNNFSQEELLSLAAYAESYSNHPIAASIVNAYGKEIDKNLITGYEEISGQGIKAVALGKQILAGNVKLMQKENIAFKKEKLLGTVVHIAVDKIYAGYIVISDEIKEDAANAIKTLKEIGIRKTVMLTGDEEFVACEIAKQTGIDEVHAQLLPHQKVEQIEGLEREKSSKGKIIFAGDGINDAPVLARADIGIAMGGIGSDAAIEAADIVIMTDEPSKIATAIKVAKRTRRIVIENIVFALGVKIILLMFIAMGLGTMWEAVFGDVGVALLAVLNAMRAIRKKY